MSVALVSDNTFLVSGGGTITVPGGGYAAGSKLIITMVGDYITGITDVKGNTYTVDSGGGANDGANFTSIVHGDIAVALAGGDTLTVSAFFGGGGYMSVWNFTGLVTSSALDKISNTSNGSSTTVTGSNTAGLANSNDLYIMVACFSTLVSLTDTTPAGLTAFTDITGTGSRYQRARWKTLASASAIGYTGTASSSASSGVIVATYKVAAGGAAANSGFLGLMGGTG